MKTLKLSLLVAIILVYNIAGAQLQFSLNSSIDVIEENGSPINKAWAGGQDCPMYSAIDLNNDGVKDMIVFDHKTNRLIPYINNNVAGISYTYAPQYMQYFPDMHDWVKTYDYNCDGYMDLFTHGNGAIACYRNNGTTPLSFTLITPQISSTYHFGSTWFSTNIYVSAVNVPSFTDLDNDGDMDILSFPLGASYIEQHKNYSMDSTGLCGGFRFYNIRTCWGYFVLKSTVNQALLPPATITGGLCPAYPATFPRMAESAIMLMDTLRHAGNVLEAIDIEGDGDKDLLTGDIVAPTVLLVENGGTSDSAYATAQDTIFPLYDTLAYMENIAAPSIMDVNNDGKKDMMVSCFNSDALQGAGENYFNTLLYENTAANPAAHQFHYIKNSFMTDEMIDVGSGAHPVFYDVNKDGLKDLLVGNDYFYYTGGTLKGRIAYYQNTGTSLNPEFTLIDRDFAGLSAYNLTGIYPTFADLDGDFDDDMLLGNFDASLTFFRNTAGPGNPVNFVFDSYNYQNISVGSNGQQSIPVFYDLDNDLRQDLIIGKRTGRLYYYHNTGTSANPVFTFVTDTLGEVNVQSPVNYLGYSAPVFYDSAGITHLLVGSFDGEIWHYTNIDNNLTGKFTLVGSVLGVKERIIASPAVADINGDGLKDLIVGNLAGGLRCYTEQIIDIAAIDPDPVFNCYPNPASGIINVEFNSIPKTTRNIIIADVLGKTVMNINSSLKKIQIDVSHLVTGSYLISIDDGGKTVSQKIIIN
jgi:hypothetical protein